MRTLHGFSVSPLSRTRPLTICRASSRIDRRHAILFSSGFLLGSSLPKPLHSHATLLLDAEEVSTIQDIYRRVTPCVVVIVDEVKAAGGRIVDETVGSGIVWSTDGVIVTTYKAAARLARNASGEQVTKIGLFKEDGTPDGEYYQATLIASAPAMDLAVLSIDVGERRLAPAVLADPTELRVGQTALAVGCTEGRPSLSLGVLSGVGRTIPAPTGQRMYDVLQTDAIITGTSAGGGLFDSFGRLAGLALSTKKDSSNALSRVNFAVSTESLLAAVPRLIVCKTTSSKCV